jgi:glycosidase
MYYGTEIIMAGSTHPNDGFVRFDFPGGWEGDQQNKFIASGRTAQEQEVFDWTKKLANFRRSSPAIKSGKLLQFVPQDGLYVYFRYDNNQTVMCVMNTNDKELTVDFNKYAEAYKNFIKAKSVTSDQEFSLKSTWPLGGKQMWVLELAK